MSWYDYSNHRFLMPYATLDLPSISSWKYFLIPQHFMAYSPLPYIVNYNLYDIFNWCGGCENLVTSTFFWTSIGHKLIENKHSESGMFFEVSFMVWHTTSLNPWPCRNSMLIFTEFSNTHIIKSFWEIFYWGADLLQFKN